MASEYDALTGTSVYARQAQGWMDGDLGANPWGASFIVGDGTVFPDCIQHQVANLVGSARQAGARFWREPPSRDRPPEARGGGWTVWLGVPEEQSGGSAYCPVPGPWQDGVPGQCPVVLGRQPAIDLTATTPLAMAWFSGSAP